MYEALTAKAKSGLRSENFRMDIEAAYSGEGKEGSLEEVMQVS